MNAQSVLSHDGVLLKYGYSEAANGKQWLALINPFGLKLELADAFFEFFKNDYNLITWEARSILANADHQLAAGELSVDNHVADLITILEDRRIEKTILVGYCSGAGIALAAVNARPEKFNDLILVSGEYTLLDDASCTTQFGSDINSLLPIASVDEKSAQFILDRMQFNKDENIPQGIHLPFSKAHYLHRYAVNYLSYRATDFARLASSVKHRTLIIAGERDQQTNINSSNKIKQLIPDSQIYIDPQGDHYGSLRYRSNTLVKIREYLSEQL